MCRVTQSMSELSDLCANILWAAVDGRLVFVSDAQIQIISTVQLWKMLYLDIN